MPCVFVSPYAIAVREIVMDKNILRLSGIDYDAGVRRVMDDVPLYEELLDSFITDSSFSSAEAAFDKQDYKSLFNAVHTLKGTSGNLDMTLLFKASDTLTEYLRHNDSPDPQKTTELFGEMKNAYARVIQGIREASR